MTHNKSVLKKAIGTISLVILVLSLLICYFFIEKDIPFSKWNPVLHFTMAILLLLSAVMLFNFHQILFDNQEYLPNDSLKALVEKIRFRAVLFNNIAIILFLMIIAIILVSFYLVFKPYISNSNNMLYDVLSIRISATVLLVFLVQILFRVFKYLLRVAAFYNARADAIEFDQLSTKLALDKSMDLFTPDKYDISELENGSFLDSISKAIKGK
jgi:hypothetical protein